MFKRTPGRLGIVIAAAAVCALAGAAPAPASPCNGPSLSDADGFNWQQTSGGYPTVSTVSDTYTFDVLIVNGSSYSPTDTSACSSEDAGREMTWPVGSVSGVTVTRKLYVPASAPSFSRMLSIVTNPTSSPVSVTLADYDPSVGGATHFRSTSSGDAALTILDDWAVMANTTSPSAPTKPVLTHLWDSQPAKPFGVSALSSNPGGSPWNDGDSSDTFIYNGVQIAPGKTAVLMTLQTVRPATGLATAIADAATLGAAPDAVYSGMSPTELSELLNWSQPDGDGDGVNSATDNCPATANADQADTDGDGQGDACDADDDGDGLPDATEAQLGTDPLRSDTDGDGHPDGADACPTQAATTPNGCPSLAPPGGDTTPPALSVGGLPKTIKRKALLAGVRGTATCGEPCRLDVTLLGSPKSAQLARAFGLQLGTKALPFGTGKRSFKVVPSRSAIGRAKRFSVQVRVVATDRGGNSTTRLSTIKVR
jgi:hypothetical protein